MRYDLIPLVMGVLILVMGLFVSSMLGQLGSIIGAIGQNAMLGKLASAAMAGELIRLLGLLYVIAIFLRLFLPFFGVGYRSKSFRFLFVITEPLLKPLREALERHTLAPALQALEIRESELGPDAEVRGAVLLALQHSETYYRVVFRA